MSNKQPTIYGVKGGKSSARIDDAKIVDAYRCGNNRWNYSDSDREELDENEQSFEDKYDARRGIWMPESQIVDDPKSIFHQSFS